MIFDAKVGTYKVPRYQEICASAYELAHPVLDVLGHHAGETDRDCYHRSVVSTDADMPVAAVGAAHTKAFVRSVCDSLGFHVSFQALPHAVNSNLYGCPSWLVVTDKVARNIAILYDPVSIGPGVCEREPFYAWDKRLAKVLLHECGHAALHLEKVLKDDEACPPSPGRRGFGLSPEHEQEAWLWSMVVWGIFTGDFAKDSRQNGGPDLAFGLA
jgi:hypothetical protein